MTHELEQKYSPISAKLSFCHSPIYVISICLQKQLHTFFMIFLSPLLTFSSSFSLSFRSIKLISCSVACSVFVFISLMKWLSVCYFLFRFGLLCICLFNWIIMLGFVCFKIADLAIAIRFSDDYLCDKVIKIAIWLLLLLVDVLVVIVIVVVLNLSFLAGYLFFFQMQLSLLFRSIG